ncbi:UNVERIFIED_CONTAM: hypothetical protein HHA_451640 [Hammondia hammondi]|eukprot:XP_008884534.1 hypothetical protein HHA_451640 [Hammondia hammondi]
MPRNLATKGVSREKAEALREVLKTGSMQTERSLRTKQLMATHTHTHKPRRVGTERGGQKPRRCGGSADRETATERDAKYTEARVRQPGGDESKTLEKVEKEWRTESPGSRVCARLERKTGTAAERTHEANEERREIPLHRSPSQFQKTTDACVSSFSPLSAASLCVHGDGASASLKVDSGRDLRHLRQERARKRAARNAGFRGVAVKKKKEKRSYEKHSRGVCEWTKEETRTLSIAEETAIFRHAGDPEPTE